MHVAPIYRLGRKRGTRTAGARFLYAYRNRTQAERRMQNPQDPAQAAVVGDQHSASVSLPTRGDRHVRAHIAVCCWEWEGPPGSRRKVRRWTQLWLKLCDRGRWQARWKGQPQWRAVQHQWVRSLGIFGERQNIEQRLRHINPYAHTHTLASLSVFWREI